MLAVVAVFPVDDVVVAWVATRRPSCAGGNAPFPVPCRPPHPDAPVSSPGIFYPGNFFFFWPRIFSIAVLVAVVDGSKFPAMDTAVVNTAVVNTAVEC